MCIVGKGLPTRLRVSLVVIDDRSEKALIGVPVMEDHIKNIRLEERTMITKEDMVVPYEPANRKSGPHVARLRVGGRN